MSEVERLRAYAQRQERKGKIRVGGLLTTVDYLTVGSQKRRQNQRINRWVVACLSAYRKAGKAMIQVHPGVLFVRRRSLAMMRLDYERIQAIARSRQASQGRSTGLAVFRRRLTWNRSGQVQSLKPIDHECAERYQDRSGCMIASYRYAVTDAFRILLTNVESWTVGRLLIRLLDGV